MKTLDIENKMSGERYFTILGMIFVAVLLISNIAAQKLFSFGAFTFSCGILVFPISYIFGDVLTEVYGYKKSRQIIWTAFFCNIFMVIILQISVALPPAYGWNLQDQFSQTLGMVPRIVIASMCGYLIGEFSNSIVLSMMKVRSNGKHLWMRTIASTIVGEGFDTIFFVIIAFWGILPITVLLSAGISGYIFKVLYEILITPITYKLVNFLKKVEGIDVYDYNINYNPLSFK